jgi:hypothetical protein
LQVKSRGYSIEMLRAGFARILCGVDKEPRDAVLAAEISRRLAKAKARLDALMAERGLRRADGWTVLEDLRSRPEYTEYIFRPIHRRFPAPELATSVAIDFDGRPVDLDNA